LPYLLRLLCICLASFFVVHLALGLAARSVAPAALRLAGRMGPRNAARLLLWLRLLPPAIAILAVIALCVPGYLWLEDATAEPVGAACVVIALLGVAVWTVSIARGVRAMAKSVQLSQSCQRAGRETLIADESSPVWMVADTSPLLVLAGIVHPRVFISESVVSALSPGELASAVRHERAHRISRDNLKRLLMLLSPGVLPGYNGYGAIERGWSRAAEWAADDRAVAGDPGDSLSLAAALVRVARLGPSRRLSLATSLLGTADDLAERVDRLLRSAPPNPEGSRSAQTVAAGVASVLTTAVLALILQPATQYSVHRFLERLIH
jgi:Zn-dependent protease with chaperone function